MDANGSVGIAIYNTTSTFVLQDIFVHARHVVWEGVLLEKVSHGTVTNVTVSMDTGAGVAVLDSSEVNVTGSTLTAWKALWFLRSHDCRGSNNTINGLGGDGVIFVDSSRVTVADNHIFSGSRGVHAESSSDSAIAGNSIAGAYWWSITLFISRNVTVRGNVMSTFGSQLPGGIELNVPIQANTTNLVFADTHTITPDNTILGLPILYFKDCRNTVVDRVPAGQVIFAGCHGIVLSNMTLRGEFGGLVSLVYTSNWTLVRNSFYAGSIDRAGAFLNEHDLVALNNFYGAGFEGNGGSISLNLPYLVGGNYWSGYRGADHCSGPAQKVCPDPDGFGDTPWSAGIFGTDQLPRMRPLNTSNTAPRPSASVNPPDGVPSTIFVFDASASADDQDPSSVLQVRWDWNLDGVWDTDWSFNKTAAHSFASPGSYSVGLEVRDSEGWLAGATASLAVGPTPLAEIIGSNWAAIVVVALVILVGFIVGWRYRPRRSRPVSHVPSDDELAP